MMRLSKFLFISMMFLETIVFGEGFTPPTISFADTMNTTYSLVKSMDPALWGTVKEWKKHFEEEGAFQNKKTPVFFYFFTTGENNDGMSEASLSRFNTSASRIKKAHPDVRFYALLKGFPKNSARMAIMIQNEATRGNATLAGTKIKFFPDLFEDLQIVRAPAYAFAMCEKDFGQDRGCDFYYLARGSIGLDGFLELLAGKDHFFDGWAETAGGGQL